LLILTEHVKVGIVFRVSLILREIPRVSIVVSVIVIIEVLEIWYVTITILETAICRRFVHTRVEWLDEGLAGELDSMIEASNVVSFFKGVLEGVKGGCLNII
jgi:hypothetical protein